jgi:linearmycin/streptolysin S transport system ATP-binding protein
MSFLEITRLRKTFDSLVAVDDVSFSIEANETFGLLGPNGAGKSTTMMMLAGLVAPDSGSIRLDGRELTPGDRHARRPMGVVPQDLAVYPRLTALENLTFFGRLYGLRGAKLKRRTDDILQLIGLTDRARSVTETFSGGMKRRLNFGVALLHEPRLLILDEPTVGVDPQSRAYLLQCVKDLCAGGVSVIYCSHYMEEVQELCNRVAIIDHGKVLACDRIDHLLGRVDFEVRLHATGVSPAALATLKARPGVDIPPHNSQVTVAIQYADAEQSDALASTLVASLKEIETAGGSLDHVDADEPDLERLFLQMAGSKLRD